MATPTTISDAADARDLSVVGAEIFFRVGPEVFRVQKNGTDKKVVYRSEDLVRAYVDSTAMLLIESAPDTTNATIRVVTMPNQGLAAATSFNAAGTRVFASNETSFFLLADTPDGDAIFQVNKANPAAQIRLTQTPNIVITHPQVANSVVWYVRDNQRIYKIALDEAATDDGGNREGIPGEDDPFGLGDPVRTGETTAADKEPSEVFGIGYSSCGLAVGDSAVFCTFTSGLERRDLTGGGSSMILDAQRSKTRAGFGIPLSDRGTLFIRSDAPDEKVKHVIRSVKPGDSTTEEKFVACGRARVIDLVADEASIVWTEEGAGVFTAPR